MVKLVNQPVKNGNGGQWLPGFKTPKLKIHPRSLTAKTPESHGGNGRLSFFPIGFLVTFQGRDVKLWGGTVCIMSFGKNFFNSLSFGDFGVFLTILEDFHNMRYIIFPKSPNLGIPSSKTDDFRSRKITEIPCESIVVIFFWSRSNRSCHVNLMKNSGVCVL